MFSTIPDQYMDGDRDSPGYRPDPLGQDTNQGRPSLGRPGKDNEIEYLMTLINSLNWLMVEKNLHESKYT